MTLSSPRKRGSILQRLDPRFRGDDTLGGVYSFAEK